MIALIADFLLWLSAGLCLIQMGAFFGERRFSHAAASTLFLTLSVCFGALIYSFAISDFSLRVVFENSHMSKPLIYKISGTWGNHEGSLLLLTWILSLYGFVYSRTLFNAKALAVQGFICLAFILFMEFTSNPFELLPMMPRNGHGLNPLLQDIGLALHPPMLYLGYVGFSLVFSIAIGYLLSAELDKNFARSMRLWCMTAWSFLTLGIGLGSWWAYRELGWGGFWFWDPVENVSLMPWLCGTALLHSLIVTEKRKVFKKWTFLLAIITFGFSLTGFFLVRSGVLSSVHSFASSPMRGIAMLLVIGSIIGFALMVYGLRAHKLKSKGGEFDFLSRETGILFNNLLMVVLTATVFTGTVYPLILTSLGGPSISVGPPFYAITFVPIAVVIIYLCAITTLTKWRTNNLKRFALRIFGPLTPPLAAAITLYFFADFTLVHLLVMLSPIYLLTSVIWEFHHRRSMENVPMIIAHGGLAILVIGIFMATNFASEIRPNIKKGEEVKFAGYDIKLLDVVEDRANNYVYRKGVFEVNKNGKVVTNLYPEMRYYPVEMMPTNEADIYHRSGMADLYTIIGEKNSAGAYAVRMYYKPFVSMIWLGCIIMFAGGMLRVLIQLLKTHRYRHA